MKGDTCDAQNEIHNVKANGRTSRQDGAGDSKTSLRRAVHERLLRVGFSKNGSGYCLPAELTKDAVRQLHRLGRKAQVQRTRALLRARGKELIQKFADGSEVNPTDVAPELVRVRAGTAEADLFRMATLLWSVPVSSGFGRRLRFLVRDKQNGKLIGIFGLTDPVFNLAARDDWIGWSVDDRRKHLVRVMDAYVLGAVPPYAQLLGGKLVAALTTSAEVLKAHERQYRGTESVITEEIKPSKLVLLTTTSALGRSSLYNRLRIPAGATFHRIGTTEGFGHFHLSGHVFERLRGHLEAIQHPYASGHRFGMGPNWRMRVLRTALKSIGLEPNGILRHGIQREVFGVPLADNWREILKGEHSRVRARPLPIGEIAAYCVSRWVVPRSMRDSAYRTATRDATLSAMTR